MSNDKFALVFPGQGSQSVGMLSEYHAAFSCFADSFRSVSEVLGYDLWALIQNGPADKLNLTQNTQPALLTSSSTSTFSFSISPISRFPASGVARSTLTIWQFVPCFVIGQQEEFVKTGNRIADQIPDAALGSSLGQHVHQILCILRNLLRKHRIDCLFS